MLVCHTPADILIYAKYPSNIPSPLIRAHLLNNRFIGAPRASYHQGLMGFSRNVILSPLSDHWRPLVTTPKCQGQKTPGLGVSSYGRQPSGPLLLLPPQIFIKNILHTELFYDALDVV